MIIRLLLINVHHSIKKLALKAAFFLLSAGITTTITQETILHPPNSQTTPNIGKQKTGQIRKSNIKIYTPPSIRYQLH
ncbi:hypothetical protein CMK22_01470 [Candidatus Poribacteria bacterium]|nr:hypothetical protein [Candidatus Poribacteria bacterium]